MRLDLAFVMERQADVFTVEQALASGMTRDELRSRVRRGDLVQIRRGVYTAAESWRSGCRHRLAVAAALVNRRWDGGPSELLVAGHRSAAFLWGLPLPHAVPSGQGSAVSAKPLGPPRIVAPPIVELVSADRCRRTYRAGVAVRPALLLRDHATLTERVPVTSLARTAVDLMRESSRQDAMIIADRALRLRCDPAELTAVAALCSGWRGGRQAVELAALASPHAESAAESVGRLLCHDRGLPTSTPQHEIRDVNGRRRRLDIAFTSLWTCLEPDGKIKYDDPYGDPARVLWEEKLREDAIRDAGWEVVRATWQQLTREPDQVVARLRAAFARAALRHAC